MVVVIDFTALFLLVKVMDVDICVAAVGDVKAVEGLAEVDINASIVDANELIVGLVKVAIDRAINFGDVVDFNTGFLATANVVRSVDDDSITLGRRVYLSEVKADTAVAGHTEVLERIVSSIVVNADVLMIDDDETLVLIVEV